MRKHLKRHLGKTIFAAAIAAVTVSAILLHQTTAEAFSGGAGTSGNPYLISSCSDLAAIDSALAAYFRLTQNLDCGEVTPLARNWDTGADQPTSGYNGFTGQLDGNGKSIVFKVTASPDQNCRGLFCYIKGGDVHNLSIGGEVKGGRFVGGLVGLAGGNAQITGISSSVIVNASPSTDTAEYIGGIAGAMCHLGDSCAFDDNTFSGSVTVNSNQGAGFAGGLAGTFMRGVVSDNEASRNYNSGNVTVTSSQGGGGVGGLIGYGNDVTITQSVNTGNVTVTATTSGVGTGQVFQSSGLFGTGANIGIVDSYNTGNITANAPGTAGVGGHSFGGLIGYGTEMTVERSYNVGSITINVANLTFDGVGGLIGFAPDDTVIQKSFNAGTVNSNTASTSKTGAIVGDSPDGAMPISVTYYDITRSGVGVCVGNLVNSGCTGVNSGSSQSSYFFGNSTNAPLNTWDFANIWRTNTGAYPTLRAFSSDDPAETPSSQSASNKNPEPSKTTVTASPQSTTNQDTTQILLDDFEDYLSDTGAKLEDLKVGQVLHFEITADTDDSQEPEQHSVTISQIGKDFVVVTLASSPFNATLYVGQTHGYDVTRDGKNDIEITLRSIKNGTADLTFKQLAGATNGTPKATIKKVAAASSNRLWLGLAALFAAAGLAAVIYIFYRRQHKSKPTNGQIVVG